MLNEPSPHVDQLIRQTRAHHVQLSVMADLKANMLLTMASLVITLLLPQIRYTEYRTSIVILIIFCLFTIILAAYSSMPKIPILNKKKKTLNSKSPMFNLLFFGDFSRIGYDEFSSEMNQLMSNPKEVYEAQIKEIYLLGSFLAKKSTGFCY